MKPIKFKFLILLLLPLSLMANYGEGNIKKQKVTHKTYQVGNSGTVYIDNSYGNINVDTWQKNSVEITVTVKVDGNNDDMVYKQLKNIDVVFSQNGNQIKAVTDITSVNNSWSFWSLFSGNNKNINYKINYEIKMPINHDLKISNDYGNIYVDELNGNLDLNADYGRFNLGDLNGKDNKIIVDYFATSSIDFMNNGEIRADYSRINIGSAYTLKMACDYTTIKIDNIRNLYYSNDYGAITVNNSTVIKADGDYQRRVFANVNSLKLNGDYGSLTINGLKQNFDNISLICDYVTIKINNNTHVAYQFKMNQEYGCFKNENLYIRKNIQESGEKHIEGYYKDENATSTIKIIEDYGCVKVYN